MMDFRTAYIIRKPFAWILFFDIIVEILISSFE